MVAEIDVPHSAKTKVLYTSEMAEVPHPSEDGETVTLELTSDTVIEEPTLYTAVEAPPTDDRYLSY